jgi:predicted ABC-type transport system involved in lysophospholipase L1 biosynthesis ATPase subunit
MSSEAVLRAEGLAKDYANGPSATSVLKGVSMQVEAGELVAVVGPSGAAAAAAGEEAAVRLGKGKEMAKETN